jgi:heme exporter protein CcmD
MGGYAAYVWGAYGLTLAAMGGEVFVLVRRHRKLRDASERTAASLASGRGPR